MGMNPNCPGYNYGKNRGDKLKYISSRSLFIPPPSPSIQYLPVNLAVTCLHDTHGVGLPTNPGSMLGQRRIPLLVQ